MTDNELISDFFKLAPLPEVLYPSFEPLEIAIGRSQMLPPLEIGLFACKITWDGPHEPVSNWVKVAEFPADPDPALVRKNILRVLKQKTYFKSCNVCGEKNPTGWMEGSTCHSCMENDGVVF